MAAVMALNSEQKNVPYWNVVWFYEFRFRASTVHACFCVFSGPTGKVEKPKVICIFRGWTDWLLFTKVAKLL